MRLRLIAAAALLTASAPVALRAQGNLSTLGFGYPTAQLSTRALGTAGATGETDPLSATNPAALLTLGGSVLYFQAEPEYRTLHLPGGNERTTVARYPLVTAGVPLTQSLMLGVNFSNLLDRTFETVTRSTALVGGNALPVTNSFSSNGAIADIRVGLSYQTTPWLKLGAAAHAITGDNRLTFTEAFDDSTRFAKLSDTATVAYVGTAYSAGFEAIAGGQVSISGSYKRGGAMSMRRNDSTIARAHVPDKLALSVAYLGIRGSSIAVRTAKDNWSNMQDLATGALRISNGWDTSIGADILGPRFGDRTLQLRGGYRMRTLPFGLPTSDISEKSFTAGAGTFLGRGHAALDVAVMRATRSTNTALSESALTLSVGITVRP